ncbi:hypothetical protein D9Q98_009762 [Chlorella vulgaris]|uniref:Endoplasmic reticulum transmembrane protein n=1 Tax=Chlorella vulgaris TaxID=3077 RepID=A0A9D4TF12_CHLVU|nr:hypothetical protein D9Q98_009762 [Chlorella vulgaris]
MAGQLGFTLPLLVILALESLTGVLLLCPKPLNTPAILLYRSTYTQIGATVFYTIASLLLLLMITPLYETWRLYQTAGMAADNGDATTLKAMLSAGDSEQQQAATMLSFTLTASSLALMFFLRKLGAVLAVCDQQSASETAMLKQVEGLQSEYARVADNVAGEEPAGSAATTTHDAQPGGKSEEAVAASKLSDEEVAQMRKLVSSLQEMNSTLSCRVEKANRAHHQAETDLAAVRTQSKGLESEYDRLLAEHDDLKRQLQRAGMAPTGILTPKKDE